MVRAGALRNTVVSREDDSRAIKTPICSKVPSKGTSTGTTLGAHRKTINTIDHGCSSVTTRRGFSHKTTEKRARGCQDTESLLTPSQAAAKIGRLKSSMAEASDPGKVALEVARLYLSLFDYKSAVKNFRIAMRSFPGDETHDLDTTRNNGYSHIITEQQLQYNYFHEDTVVVVAKAEKNIKIRPTVYEMPVKRTRIFFFFMF